MKRLFISLAIAIIAVAGASAQKFALIDMEYILKNIPSYEMANEQLNQISLRWQKEVEAKATEAQNLYKNYQSEMVFMTDEQKSAKEAEVVAKEKEATELRYKYFGPEGELYKKRQALMQPIQEEVFSTAPHRPTSYSRHRVSMCPTRCLPRWAMANNIFLLTHCTILTNSLLSL